MVCPHFSHDLPAGLTDWLCQLGNGHITRLERHVARREAWVVDITATDGGVTEGFLRIDRKPDERSNISLRREVRICEELSKTGVPVPSIMGWNEAHHAALFSRDSGRSDIHELDDQPRQQAIMKDFIDIIADLHTLDPDTLDLNDVLGPRPNTAEECALGDLNAQLSQFAGFLENYQDPLITFSVKWLQANVPKPLARVSLVQGDTGPMNFMFKANKVSVLVDWEWGHWGDPMEDLGNISVRELWSPAGGLGGLFRQYQEQSGIPYSKQAVQYYRVQQNVRGMIPIHAICHYGNKREPLAWYLAYRYIGDRTTCEALADYYNISLTKPDFPESSQPIDPMADAALYALRKVIAPKLDDTFAQSRNEDVSILVACMERVQRFGAEIDVTVRSEISEILQESFHTAAEATSALIQAIEKDQLDKETIIRYLARKAYRDEWLYGPAIAKFPNRQWSPLD
ncbi:MAG: phosphotransferase [Halioglobus sp.]